jgi:putative heme-binding domain-containing protein
VPKPAAPTAPAAEIRMPQGPGQAWTVETALAALASTKPGNAARGKDFYQAVACAACHRFGGTGSNVGPDLTSAASKFNRRDLLVAIIDPSHDVSDQYQASLVTKKDGTVLVGRTTVDVESADQTGPVTVYPFAVDAQAITVPRAEIAKIEPSAESPMPAGLVNAMSATELADLIAYLVASNQ